MIFSLKKTLHSSVFVVIFFITVANFAWAQDRSAERYMPPPMFGGTDAEDAPAIDPPHSSSDTLDLINLDSITGWTKAAQPKVPVPAKAFKPPLPPKRPAAFQVSQDYLDRITAPARPSLFVKQRPAPPVISPPALAADALNKDLQAMDAIDIYKNINGGAEPERAFINIPARSPALERRADFHELLLDFAQDNTDLTQIHVRQINQNLLPLLQGNDFTGLTIDAPVLDNQKQRRLSLSRAIAVRDYLENNGFERAQITINQKNTGANTSGAHAVTIRHSK